MAAGMVSSLAVLSATNKAALTVALTVAWLEFLMVGNMVALMELRSGYSKVAMMVACLVLWMVKKMDRMKVKPSVELKDEKVSCWAV